MTDRQRRRRKGITLTPYLFSSDQVIEETSMPLYRNIIKITIL